MVLRRRTCPTTARASVPTWRGARRRGRWPRRSAPPAGPVHLTCRSASRWCPPATPLVDAPGRSDGRPWTARAPGVRAPSVEMLDALGAPGRPTGHAGSCVAGWGAGVRAATRAALRRGGGLAGARRPAVEPARARHGLDLRPAAARRRRSPTRTGPTSCSASAGRPPTRPRCSGSTPDIDQVLVDPDGAWLDPQHAASGRMVADPELLLGALADAVDVMVDDDVGRARGRPPTTRGARRDRRSRRRVGRAVRGSRRARRRRRGARRRRARASRRACRCATSRASPRRARGRRRSTPTVASTASTASCRPRSASRAGADGSDGRPARRPVLPARHQRTARRRRPRGRRHLRGGRQRRRRDLLVPPAGRAARALRDAVRHAAGGRPRCARRGARRSRSSRSTPPPSVAPAVASADRRRRRAGRAGRAPTAPPTSPATARSGPRSRDHCDRKCQGA